MDFAKELEQYIERLHSIKASITSEEATKTAMIMPFFALLGYDVFNPLEFTPEYIADVGVKKGEKVDYAILQNGSPIVLIEAKAVNQKLSKHSGQLYRYFSTTKAKFAILTNGIQYRFYTDLDEPNLMDPVPFNQIDLFNLKSSQVEDLLKFHKNAFDVASLLDSASILKCKGALKRIFSAQLEDPSDDFVKLLIQEIHHGVKTQSVLAKYKPILQQAMDEYVNERMNDKIKAALSISNTPSLTPPQPEPQRMNTSETGEPLQQAKPTEAEMQAFEKFCAMSGNYMDSSRLSLKKTESYVTFLLDNNVRQWICRMTINSNSITLILPDENKSELRYRIANLCEMENYRPYMLSILQRYTDLLLPFNAEAVKVYTIDLKRRCPRKRKKNA